MVRQNGLNNCKLFNLYSNSPAFVFGLHWSYDGLLSINILLENIPMYCKFSSNENILMRLWEDFGQKYCMFVVPAFCMAEDEETFSQSSLHAKCLNPGTHSQFPAALQNHTQGGSCAAPELHRPGYSHIKFEVLLKKEDKVVVFFSSGCACLSIHSWWYWSFVRHISLHALPFSLRIFKIYLTHFPFGFPGDLLLVTAAFLFQGSPRSSEMSHSVQVLFSFW